MRRIIGIIVLIIGIGLIALSMYIKGRVAEGRQEISSAQSKVDTGKQLLDTNPYTGQVGKQLMDPAQQKIDAGRSEADEYERMAKWLKIGGIVLIVLGTGAVLIRKKK